MRSALREAGMVVPDMAVLCSIGEVLLEMGPEFIGLQSNLVHTTKPDDTPVTNADIYIQRKITEVLAAYTPGVPVYGEEVGGEFQTRPEVLPDMCWVVDPIDGTRFYQALMPHWCTAVALFVYGKPCGSVVLQPALPDGECFVAMQGQGIVWRTQSRAWTSFTPVEAPVPMLIVPTSHSVMTEPRLNRQAAHLTAAFKDTCSTPSVLAALQIVRGHAWGWASIREPSDHDCAAGAMLVQEMGGTTLCADGRPIPWGACKLPPVVFARSRAKANEIICVLGRG